MSITSDPKEERLYARALGKLMEHVGKCPDCAQRVRASSCTGCGVQVRSFASMSSEGNFCDPCTDVNLKRVMTLRSPGDAPTAPAQAVLDLSNPATPLCPRGDEYRGAADEARAATPAERLVTFYALEASDVATADQHDALRGAKWLREDPGRARVIMEQLVERAGPLEDRPEPVERLRQMFLDGFRKVSPSRGAVADAEERKRKAAAADRLCAVIFDRYEKRHGAPPPVDVASEFRRGHDLWIGESGDLMKMAEDAERFRTEHGQRWTTKAMLKPKSALAELQKIGRWIAEGLIRDEAEKG